MKNDNYVKISYPFFQIFWKTSLGIGVLLLMQIYTMPDVDFNIKIDCVIFILTYLHIQKRYSILEIYSDRIKQTYPISLFLKPGVYHYCDIELFRFWFRSAQNSDPFVQIEFIDGKRKRIRMPRGELTLLKLTLSEEGVKTIKWE